MSEVSIVFFNDSDKPDFKEDGEYDNIKGVYAELADAVDKFDEICEEYELEAPQADFYYAESEDDRFRCWIKTFEVLK